VAATEKIRPGNRAERFSPDDLPISHD
jgi:hypothetical protein